MEKALRGCADAGVPNTVDLWPGIRDRVGVERTSATVTGEGRTSTGSPRRSSFPRLVPRTRAGWVLAALLVLILSTGAYAASGLVYETFVGELPGAQGPVFGQKIDQTQTADGARVTLEWAYADARFVVVGFSVEDLRDGRRVAGYPAELQPTMVMDEPGYSGHTDEEYPERARLSDESGSEFRVVGGQGQTSVAPDNIVEGPLANSAVFEAPNRIDPSGNHHFRLELPLEEWAIISMGEKIPAPEPVGEPFVLDFEIPVRPVPVAEINQKETASGLTLSLERVSNSPGRPQGVFCFQPPDDEHDWFPTGGDLAFEGGPVPGERHCLEMLLNGPLEGRSSVTVAQIEGIPHCPSGNDEVCARQERTIQGPWTFEFEAPER